MRIVLTGGHFSPALAVIQKIKKDNQIVVIGRKYAFEGDSNETYEYKICKKEGIRFENVPAGRLQRKLTSHTLPSILRFPRGVLAAGRILRREKPDVVVTFGGYIGLPIAIAASILKIPIVLHEQTQRAGLSARLISKLASVICISFDSSKDYFPSEKVVLTGNPLRKEIFDSHSASSTYSKPMIYITGGSTGAHAINEAVYTILTQLLEDFTVVHQSGNAKEFGDLEKLQDLKNSLSPQRSKRFIVREFFPPDEVVAFMQHSVIVISRSGINTVLELMAVGRMSILIPLPFGQRNEQRDNAMLFEKIGLGKMLEQKELTGERLLSLIHAMIKERENYESAAPKAKVFVHKDAADKIVEQIYKYGREKRATSQKEKSLLI